MERRRKKPRQLKNENETEIPPTAAAAAAAASSHIPPWPPWTELPVDLTANILRRLGAEEILKSAQKVCSTWNKVCRLDPSLWLVVDLTKRLGDDEREFDLMCRCAVDRSRGQLIDLRIYGFGGVELLNYVAHRSSHLRRLTFSYRGDISAFGLAEALRKLPQLEELHLLLMASVQLGAENVETIGNSCPLLKSFTLTHSQTRIALVIARTMPNLHRLRLLGDRIENEGLEAILDGCPRLEMLDVWDCYGLDLEVGTLRERCFHQIKDLWLPYRKTDLFNDY